MGVAGAAQGTDPGAEITVFTDFEDAAYSPCGIPYVHGKEIASFETLFMATKQQYLDQGIDIRYETRVAGLDPKAHTVTTSDGKTERYDSLVLATGFTYADPGVPGGDLGGLYYVKNIRRAMEWDKVLDGVRAAVVDECTPLGAEMVTALAHRGIETHLVDPTPWGMSMATDPDIMEPVQQSWEEMGVKLHFNTKVTSFNGTNGQVSSVSTSGGDITADLVVPATDKEPNTALAVAAGVKTGMSGGIIVDGRMRTSLPDVYAAGDCTEIPHGVSNVPIQGLSGSHAYSQGKVAGVGAAGGIREYNPVFVPWGMVAGKWMIGGVSFSETLATALGMEFVVGLAQGISRARYYPDVKQVLVKLLVEPKGGRLIGAQMVGGEGIKERADFLAMVVRTGITVQELATMENVYSPPIGALNEPIALAAQNALTQL